MKKPTKYFIIILIVTIFFCLAIGLDISPYLRGPAPYPPEWQWAYFFVNTLSRIYFPIICILILIALFWLHEKRNIFAKKTNLLLILLVLVGFSFQMSLLFFSRSGISVLIHRIINPELNSYFTASLSIHNPIDFLKNYEQELQHFVYHARSHPPGATLIFYGIKQLIAPFAFLIDLVSRINPIHGDVRQLWNTLLPIDKATAVFSAFFIPLLSTLVIIPLYHVGKILYGVKIATRYIFIFILMPSIVFFIPINDVLLPLFSISSFLFLLKGLKNNNIGAFLFSGIILFLGAFISLSMLPLFVLFLVFAILFIKNNNLNLKKYFKGGIFFVSGFIILPVLMFIFLQFNSLWLIQTILQEVVHIHTRSYTTWLFYNIYDFFVFAGIPIAIVFLTQIRKLNKSDILFISFLITLIVVDLSGSTRGETGRIWAPFLPFFVLPAVAFLTKKMRFSTTLFIGFLLIQAMQILVMQEFWVMLW